jgi:hypothetical protein
MSYTDGWSAMNLEMPQRIPRVEFDADMHWPLVRAVTGIDVDLHSPGEVKQAARSAFVRAWNYDLVPVTAIGNHELNAKRTYMGHSEYAAGGTDFDQRITCPFESPEEVYDFDPWATYGEPDTATLVQRFNDHYRRQCGLYSDAVNTSGIYITLFSGLIAIFGWEMLLTAGGMDPRRFGEVANRYAGWIQQYYDALAQSETPVVWSHDDIVWAAGPVFRPAWYRQYIFPHYERFYTPLIEAGKKVLFVSDGNYTALIDDIAATGVHGFFFEPLTDLDYVVEHYRQSHVIIGNADTRVLLGGDRAAIRREVERCMTLGRACPGYMMSVTNMIPANTPIESALAYNEIYQELSTSLR